MGLSVGKIKKRQKGGTCSLHGRDEKYLQNVDKNTLREKTIWHLGTF
jgi:hypothetical protein